MEFQDNVVVRFTGNIAELEAAIKKASGLMKNMPNTVGNTRGGADAQRDFSRQTQASNRAVNTQNKSIATNTQLMKQLQSQTGDFTTSFRRAALSLQTGTEWLDKFSIQADRASMMMWKFTMAGVSLNQLAATTGAVAVGFGMVVKKMVDSFSMIDRLKRQFSAIYESAEIGSRMVDKLVEDAVRIRYTIEETIEAGRLLAVEGFNPEKLIMDMADLAAGVNQEGISIVNATRAFVDAANGQFRRLKETFQVSREDAMEFAPDAFAGPNNQISNQAKATDAILRAIRAKYRGMNAATMQTVTGMMSNLDDAVAQSMAKMGMAINDTVVKWIKTAMNAFERLGEFAETGIGKTIANTLLWGAATMTVVTALALLSSGMITLIGLFAAYNILVQTRQKGMKEIIEAEMKLMALDQTLAHMEAERSMQEIGTLHAKLKLSEALHAQRKADMALFVAERTGGDVAGSRAAVASANAGVAVATAGVAVQELPLEIIQLQKELAINRQILTEKTRQLAVNRTDATISGERLTALRAEVAAQRTITAELQAQLAAKKIALSQAEIAAGVTAQGQPPLAARTGGTFKGGVSTGAGMVGSSIIGMFAIFLGPLQSLVAGLKTAVVSAGGLAAALGVVTGAVLVLGGIAVVGLAVKHILDKNAETLRIFRASLDDASNKLNSWAKTLDITPAQRVASEQSQKGMQTLRGVGVPGAFGEFAGIGRTLLDIVAPFTRGGKPFVPGMVDRMSVGKRVVDASQGDLSVSRQMIADMIKASQEAGRRAPGSLRGLKSEDVANMTEEEIRNITMSADQYYQLTKDIQALYEKQNESLRKQGEAADKIAREFAKTKADVEGITEEEKAVYEQIANSTSPAQMLAKYLRDSFNSARDTVPEAKDLLAMLDDAYKVGTEENQIREEITGELETAKKALAEMEVAQEGLLEMGAKMSIDEQKSLDATRQKVALLSAQVDQYEAITKLLETQRTIELAQATGLGNVGAVFGADMAAGEQAAAKAAIDMKERQKHMKAMVDWQRKAIEDSTKQSLDLYSPGANAKASDRVAYEKQRAQQERERMRRVEEELYRPMLEGTTDEKQRQAIEKQIELEKKASERTAKSYDDEAANIALQDRIKLLEVERQKRAATSEDMNKLLKYDIKILELKEQQAKAANDEAAVLSIQQEKVEARRKAEVAVNDLMLERLSIEKQLIELEGATPEDIEKNAEETRKALRRAAKTARKQGRDTDAAQLDIDASRVLVNARKELLDIEEKRLKFLLEEAAVGRATSEEVQEQREKLARQYEEEAKKATPGSREEMDAKSKASEHRGDRTIDETIRHWEAYRREQAMGVETEGELLSIDLKILELKEQQAKIAGDEAAVRDIQAQKKELEIEAERQRNQLLIDCLKLEKQIMDITGATVDEVTANMQAQYAAHMQEANRLRAQGQYNEAMQEEIAANAAIKTGREAIVATEEDRLRIMEKQAERGLVTPEQVAAQREGVAQQYEWMASQFKPGSAENMAWQNKAMDMRGGGIDDQIKAWETYRRSAALSTESAAELLSIDLEIIETKKRQAEIMGDANAIANLDLEKVELRRRAEEETNRLLRERLNIEKEMLDIHGATAEDVIKNATERYNALMEAGWKASAEGRDVEAQGNFAAADRVILQSREELLGIEEQRLQLMEEQNKQGLISDRELSAQKQKVAEHRRWLGSQFKKGSVPGMKYETSALQSEGEERDRVTNEEVERLQTLQSALAVNGASQRELFKYDVQMARVKMQKAIAEKDINAQLAIQVGLAERLKSLHQSELSDAEAKLSFMQTQADMGLISQEAVDMEKRKLAEMYRTRAQQAAYGSAEYYQNMQKSMELLKDETEDSWSGIIGKILGAPQSLIDQVVSSGWISQQFGNMENVLGLGRGIQAEIASQSRREVVVRVNWENLDAVSNKVEAVLPRAMGAFAKEFTHGMSTA